MKYTLGLDIGITSVGWAVLNLDDRHVEDMGVRAFNAAENPKTRASLAAPRREARCARRRLRRRAGRLRRAKDLFVKHGLVAADRREAAFLQPDHEQTPWKLRAEGLDRLLSGEEFARALFHIIKRRGFKSNRKKVKKADDGKMLAGIGENTRRMDEYGYRTAGEMYWRDSKFEVRKRNTTDSYLNTVDRPLLEKEIAELFDRQRGLGSEFAATEFEQAIVDVFLWQKPYASGDDIIKMIGYCTFEKTELRAPRNSYHAERCMLLQKVNSLTYWLDGDRPRLDSEQRSVVQGMAYDQAKVTYAQVRKAVGLSDDARFAGLTYTAKPGKDGEPPSPLACESATFCELKGYHALRRACSGDGLWDRVKTDPDLMDHLASALTFYKTDDDIRAYLIERGVEEAVIEAVDECEFAKTSNLSLVAIKKIIPHLERGLLYNEACAEAGYNHSGAGGGPKQAKLPVISVESVRNPVVLRALTQARKVVNAVIDRYGSPYAVRIEFAREMGKSAEKRREIEKRQKENANERAEVAEQFRELFNREAKGGDVLKWRLYREQEGKCAYSMRPIELDRLFESGYAEVDHILPYSRSFDDTRANKALVLTAENRNKLNRTPFECFGHTPRWAEYEAWVKATIRDPRKRANLLRESFDERQEKEFKDRNLVDTSYIAREFASFVRDSLLFADSDNKLPLQCVNGRVTAQARWLWGLHKDREENDLHHAQDAAVIAALLPHQVKLLTEYSKVTETGQTYVDLETGEVIEHEKPRLPHPWPGFRKEVLGKLPDIMVSRMPQHKAGGALHEDTIRSTKALATQGVSTVKKRLTSLSENDLANLFDPEHNERLYAAIRTRMAEHSNKAEKAFAEPLHKPLRDGSPGPEVKSVKVCQTQNTGVKVRSGIADNGGIVRTDVFRKPNRKGQWEYYLIPVYSADCAVYRKTGSLPDRAIAAGKSEDEWPVVDESFDFLFSLQPYDLVRIAARSEDRLYYYKGAHRGKGALKVSLPNRNAEVWDVGVRTAERIEKFAVGVLGEYHPVRKEVRLGLANGGDIESGEAEG